jgi:hypothetical protein
MSVYHSSLCRMAWTSVPAVVPSSQYLSVAFGLTLDTGIWFTSGNFYINFNFFQAAGQLVRSTSWSGFIGTNLPGRPSGGIWLSYWWNRASDATGGSGIFLFRPSIVFVLWGPGGSIITGEFAVAEEENYFLID